MVGVLSPSSLPPSDYPPPRIMRTVERVKEFEAYLQELGYISYKQYSTHLRRASEILGEAITPQLLPNQSSVATLMKKLEDSETREKSTIYKATTRNAFRRYAELVEADFKVTITSILRHPNPRSVAPLSPKGRLLLEEILKHVSHQDSKVEDPSSFPTYEVLYRRLVADAPNKIVQVGRHLRRHGLDDLNDWTLADPSLPRITGLIVNKYSHRPGEGFTRKVQGIERFDEDWWLEEVRKSLTFDWSPFIGSQKEDSPVFPSIDLDADDLPGRMKTTVSRIIRDTAIVRKVKALHEHTCQVCNVRVTLRAGQYYSEAHHLKPLGKPHNGPDKETNLICVCPTCHVKLDYAAMKIDPAKIRSVDGHKIAGIYLTYHNKLCL